MSSISWAITVCNELDEITKLCNYLHPQIHEDDEILIQYDSNNVTPEVLDFIKIFDQLHENVNIVGFPLNEDFGKFKSNLREHATKEFIFQLDADEIPHKYLIQGLPQILEGNDTDVFFVPRINTVEGITEEHVNKWGWKVQKFESQENTKELDPNSDEYKYLDKLDYIISEIDPKDKNGKEHSVKYHQPVINFPDYQTRIYRNTPHIEWMGKVHEKITGYDTFTALPAEEQFCIYHPKEIERQEKQNEFYDTL